MVSETVSKEVCQNALLSMKIVQSWCDEISAYLQMGSKITNTVNVVKESFVSISNLDYLRRRHLSSLEEDLPEKIKHFLA